MASIPTGTPTPTNRTSNRGEDRTFTRKIPEPKFISTFGSVFHQLIARPPSCRCIFSQHGVERNGNGCVPLAVPLRHKLTRYFVASVFANITAAPEASES